MTVWLYRRKAEPLATVVTHDAPKASRLARDPELELVVVQDWPMEFRPEWDEWRDVHHLYGGKT